MQLWLEAAPLDSVPLQIPEVKKKKKKNMEV